MSNIRVSSSGSGSLRSLMAMYAIGASIALAQPHGLPEVHAEPEVEVAVTPSVQAIFEMTRTMQRLRITSSSMHMTEDFCAETDLDYSYMDRHALAATHAPNIAMSESDRQMYSGLSNFPSVPEDGWMDADDLDEAVAINRSYVTSAEHAAAHAPRVALSPDSLRALAGIQMHFPRSIDFDEE